MLLDHVHAAIREHHAHVNTGVISEKIYDDRKQMKSSKGDGGREDHFTFEYSAFARSFTLGLSKILRNSCWRQQQTPGPPLSA